MHYAQDEYTQVHTSASIQLVGIQAVSVSAAFCSEVHYTKRYLYWYAEWISGLLPNWFVHDESAIYETPYVPQGKIKNNTHLLSLIIIFNQKRVQKTFDFDFF